MDLNMALPVIRTNPQMGQVTLTVTERTRAAPDFSWFARLRDSSLRSDQGK